MANTVITSTDTQIILVMNLDAKKAGMEKMIINKNQIVRVYTVYGNTHCCMELSNNSYQYFGLEQMKLKGFVIVDLINDEGPSDVADLCAKLEAII